MDIYWYCDDVIDITSTSSGTLRVTPGGLPRPVDERPTGVCTCLCLYVQGSVSMFRSRSYTSRGSHPHSLDLVLLVKVRELEKGKTE